MTNELNIFYYSMTELKNLPSLSFVTQDACNTTDPTSVQDACSRRGGGEGEGDSNIKKVGVLVASLRGVNFRFWSRLGCSGNITNIFSLQGLA